MSESTELPAEIERQPELVITLRYALGNVLRVSALAALALPVACLLPFVAVDSGLHRHSDHWVFFICPLILVAPMGWLFGVVCDRHYQPSHIFAGWLLSGTVYTALFCITVARNSPLTWVRAAQAMGLFALTMPGSGAFGNLIGVNARTRPRRYYSILWLGLFTALVVLTYHGLWWLSGVR